MNPGGAILLRLFHIRGPVPSVRPSVRPQQRSSISSPCKQAYFITTIVGKRGTRDNYQCTESVNKKKRRRRSRKRKKKRKKGRSSSSPLLTKGLCNLDDFRNGEAGRFCNVVVPATFFLPSHPSPLYLGHESEEGKTSGFV